MQLKLTKEEKASLEEAKDAAKQVHSQKQYKEDRSRRVGCLVIGLVLLGLIIVSIVLFQSDNVDVAAGGLTGIISFTPLLAWVTIVGFGVFSYEMRVDDTAVEALKVKLVEERFDFTMNDKNVKLSSYPTKHLVKTGDGFAEVLITFTDHEISVDPIISFQEKVNL